jgi:hypothetical protein
MVSPSNYKPIISAAQASHGAITLPFSSLSSLGRDHPPILRMMKNKAIEIKRLVHPGIL